MIGNAQTPCTAFEGPRLIKAGTLLEVAEATKAVIDRGAGNVIIFDDATSQPVEVDFRGTWVEVRDRIMGIAVSEGGERLGGTTYAGSAGSPGLETAIRRGPGRPRLGVVPREVTLLPRHWEWLGGQPGGASVALRKLVEQARRSNEALDAQRRTRETVYGLITVLAGNLFGYEEATRALYAGNRAGFETFAAAWPKDVREYALRLAAGAFSSETARAGGVPD